MAQPEIHALSESDLAELREFLAKGFHTSPDAPFAAEDVLRWKYLEPRGSDAGEAPRSYIARDVESRRIVGHVGICPSRFRGEGLPSQGVSTLHMIDWLSSEEGRGAGGLLMRRAHQSSETQYGFGGSAAGRGVIDRGGYDLVAEVPVYHRVLRPSYRLRDPSHGLPGRVSRALKDIVRSFTKPPKIARSTVEIRRVDQFGDEIIPITRKYEKHAILTTREPALLNYFLNYPRGGLTGRHVIVDGQLRGFAVLSIVPGRGGIKIGKIADCVVDDKNGDDWHATFLALTNELNAQKADYAVAFAANPWTVSALEESGFTKIHHLEFRLRDRGKIIPPGAIYHLTPLEADYAYT